MLTIATCLWDANDKSNFASRCYDEKWVERLYRGFRRNLTTQFRFVCLTDRKRLFVEPIDQITLTRNPPDYGCFIEPFQIDGPLIVAGLDTVIVGNIDHMAAYCADADKIALPRDPYQPERSINGIALVPPGHRGVFDAWRGENDMEWLRRYSWNAIDNLFPGEVVSLKFHDVRGKGLQGAKIIYFHGTPKPHELKHLPWVREHWQ